MDVHKYTVAACILTWEAGGARKDKRIFGTTTKDLLALSDWLHSHEVTHVAIAYASHCTSLGRCDTFSTCKSLCDNLTPLTLRGGLGPGFS
jgi:hypothetical protein